MKLWQYRCLGGFSGIGAGSLLLLALTSCDSQSAPVQAKQPRPFAGATVRHDDQRAVTCWIYSGSSVHEFGFSCLPDWMLTRAEPLKLPATWPAGEPCADNATCVAFDHRRRALGGDQ